MSVHTKASRRTEGERLKADAHAALEATRRAIVLRCRRAMLSHALKYGSVTADDVYAAIELPSDIGPKLLGCVPGPFARAGIIDAIVTLNPPARSDTHQLLRCGVWLTVIRPSPGSVIIRMDTVLQVLRQAVNQICLITSHNQPLGL